MLRLRLLRLLLPALIVGLGALLWISFKPRSAGAQVTEPGRTPQQTVATRVSVEGFPDVEGGAVREMIQQPDGSLLMDGITEIRIPREGRAALLISAGSGNRQGNSGQWSFTDQVKFNDPQVGVTLELSKLEIDMKGGVARSSSPVQFTGRGIVGSAATIEYGLKGQPGVLHQPRLNDEQGGFLFGERAFLHDGFRDVEIRGAVRAERQGKRLAAAQVRLIRDADDQLRQATAGGEVHLEWETGANAQATLQGRDLNLQWDPSGEPESLVVEGEATFRRGSDSLSADTLSAVRIQGSWRVEAIGTAHLVGQTSAGPSRLAADLIRGVIDESMHILEGDADGHVSFDSSEIRAEALRARFVRVRSDVDQVELFGDALNKAWLARPNQRVAAESIRTDLAGGELVAERSVEATLLPAVSDPSAESVPRGQNRLFLVGQAVHFVSESLESSEGGGRLRFSGKVRGWQGERNLAGDTVELDQRSNALTASGDVATRLPRDEHASATSSADFLQINANQLTYDDDGGTATYTGHVRVRLDEGWLEADRMLVTIGVVSRRIEEIQAFEAVRIELIRGADGALAHPISGSADRLTYRPADSKVVLFGLDQPAIVRRQGEGGGTTKGRELHYRLDTGALEVKSGSQDAGTIRS